RSRSWRGARFRRYGRRHEVRRNRRARPHRPDFRRARASLYPTSSGRQPRSRSGRPGPAPDCPRIRVMTKRAIIADDLTGALDAAAPFAARGLSTVVALSAKALPKAIAQGSQVIGVSTDSREIPPDEARMAVASVVTALPDDFALFK